MIKLLLNEILNKKSGRSLLYVAGLLGVIILLGILLPPTVTLIIIAFAVAAAIAYVEFGM